MSTMKAKLEAYRKAKEPKAKEVVPLTRVQRAAKFGAELLDRKVPKWVAMINLRTLNIAQPSNCVCGQLAATKADTAIGGRHWVTFATSLLGLGREPVRWGGGYDYSEWADKCHDAFRRHGFAATAESDYPSLTAAWREEILKRRAS